MRGRGRGRGRGKKKSAWRVCIFFFIHLTITHRSYSLQAASSGRGGQGAGVDYEDVALFSDEKKYVALIKSDADAERNYGAARRAGFIWGLAFSPSNLFFAYFCSLFLFPYPHRNVLFPISRFACRNFRKIVARFFGNYSGRGWRRN